METLKEIAKDVIIGLIVDGVLIVICFIGDHYDLDFPFNVLLIGTASLKNASYSLRARILPFRNVIPILNYSFKWCVTFL